MRQADSRGKTNPDLDVIEVEMGHPGSGGVRTKTCVFRRDLGE